MPQRIRPMISLAVLALLGVAACTAEADPPPADPAPEQGQSLVALPTVSDLATGANRFAFVLLQSDGVELEGAAVEVSFYLLEDQTAKFQASAEASYQQMAADLPHIHEDGGIHAHEEVHGFYLIPQIAFEQAGTWGAGILATPSDGGPLQTARFTFEVKERSFTPGVGDPAPVSASPTASHPDELAEVCSRQPPDDMHSISLDEALNRSRPFVAIFASPSFCQTRVCGPVTEIALSIRESYSGRVDFIHVEPYDLEVLRNEGRLSLSLTALEWSLPTEPWIFVVDAEGRLAGKFEGMVTAEELEKAISEMISAIE